MWIDCNEKMPVDMEAVIALYLDYWPGRGNSGVTDIYAVDGKWFNIPQGVHVVGWMPLPDMAHLPVSNHYIDRLTQPKKLLGCVESCDPVIDECVFEGDTSAIEHQREDHNG